MKERKSGEGPEMWVTGRALDEHVQGLRIHSQHHKDEQEQKKEEGEKRENGRKGGSEERRETKERKRKMKSAILTHRNKNCEA